MSKLNRISISLEEDLLKRFDKHIERQGYPTRSEALKALMRRDLIESEWEGNEEVAGAISIVYDHHKRGLATKVMTIQHDFGKVIISTQHVHLDHDNCLEIVVVKGLAEKIRELAAALRSVKGIKHHALTMTTSGEELG